MHYQHKNPQRARDHQISLMPMMPARPAGEPPLWVGFVLLLIIAAAVWLLITAFASPPAIASGTDQSVSSIHTPSAFEASAAGKGSVR